MIEMTRREKLARAIYQQWYGSSLAFDDLDWSFQEKYLNTADACLAFLAAEPVSYEAVQAAWAINLRDAPSNDGELAQMLAAAWRAMLEVK